MDKRSINYIAIAAGHLLGLSVQKTNSMRIFITALLLFAAMGPLSAQKSPCGSNPVYRQFDFWVGEWEAFGLKGNKAGDSKISIILDSCVVLEEWTSASKQGGITYTGKSYNTYNASTGQWQQTWVDNVGGSTAYLQGRFENNCITFLTAPFPFSKDSMAIRRLRFFNLGPNKVRQWGEISKDNGITWITEYDLEYRRRLK
jgi:hypothetical protein